MRQYALIAAGLMLGLAACGPMSPERAADQCEERARAALGPTGEIGVGVSNRSGPRTEFEISLSSDFLSGRDPQEVYEQCVRNLTGQPPIRPLRL